MVRIVSLCTGGLVFFVSLASSWSGTSTYLGVSAWQVLAGITGVCIVGFGLIGPATALTNRILRRCSQIILILVVSVVLIDVVLGILGSQISNISIKGGVANAVTYIPDAMLGRRIAPSSLGHDSNGFRNMVRPKAAQIVALGDSQTWGNGASINDTWPQDLGKLSGQTVYNMGVNGYGPLEYNLLTKDAMQLSPKVEVVGLYLGTNLWAAYNATYTRDAFTPLRDPNFRDFRILNSITSDETQTAAKVDDLAENLRLSETPAWLLWLGTHTAIGRQLSSRSRWPGFTSDDKYRAYQTAIKLAPDYGIAYDHGGVRTILTTATRLINVDRRDPRIVEGMRLTKNMLLSMRSQVVGGGGRLIVLLIPTKELVYADKVASLGISNAAYDLLIKMEMENRNEIVQFCETQGITVADPLPLLRAGVDRDEVLYLDSIDGHPTARGYYLIASAANNILSVSTIF